MLKRLKLKISRIILKIKSIKIDWNKLFVRLILFLIIIILSSNIYITFENGFITAKRFEEEQEKLLAIKKENLELIELVKEYDSLEYKRIYARENLNLAHSNETIYYIDRPKELPEIEPLEEEIMKIDFSENKEYWFKLLFGI